MSTPTSSEFGNKQNKHFTPCKQKESNARNTVRVCKKQNDGYEKYM